MPTDYDKAGRKLTEYTFGQNYSTDFRYNRNGWMREKTNPSGSTETIEFDARGVRKKHKRTGNTPVNGTSTQVTYTTSFEYDKNRRQLGHAAGPCGPLAGKMPALRSDALPEFGVGRRKAPGWGFPENPPRTLRNLTERGYAQSDHM